MNSLSSMLYKEAVKYFKMASDKGNPEAMCKYSYMFSNGQGIGANQEESLKFMKMSAEKGHLPAIETYTRMLNSGVGVE